MFSFNSNLVLTMKPFVCPIVCIVTQYDRQYVFQPDYRNWEQCRHPTSNKCISTRIQIQFKHNTHTRDICCTVYTLTYTPHTSHTPKTYICLTRSRQRRPHQFYEQAPVGRINNTPRAAQCCEPTKRKNKRKKNGLNWPRFLFVSTTIVPHARTRYSNQRSITQTQAHRTQTQKPRYSQTSSYWGITNKDIKRDAVRK